MAQEIKKTMEAPIAFLDGKLGAEDLAEFTKLFGFKSSRATSTGPKEIVILKDAEGNMLGRKCTVTNLYFTMEHFSKGTTCIKAADAARGARHAEARKALKDAESILEEAREITDIEEKVAKFEEYDLAVQEANNLRSAEIEILPEWNEGGVETIEELATSLNVEVQ